MEEGIVKDFALEIAKAFLTSKEVKKFLENLFKKKKKEI